MVLGELGSAAAHKALVKALKSENETLRLYAVEALGKINAKEAAPHLVPMLANERLRGRVQQVLLSIGDEAAPLLQKHIDKAGPELKRAIIDVLGRFRTVDLSDTMFDALLDKDPEAARIAADGLRERFANLPPAERAAAVKQVGAFLGRKLTPAATVNGLRLLGALRDGPKAVAPFLGAKNDPAVRSAAIDALARMDLDDAQKYVPTLLAALDEEPLVSSAVQALTKHAPGKEHADRLVALLDSRHAAARLFAIGALGSIGGARAAEGLIAGLFNADRRISDEAARALQGNKAFAPALIRALEGEEEVGRAFRISAVLRAHAVKSFLARMLKRHEKGEQTYKVYFEILRSVAPAPMRDAVVARGRELMKKRKFDAAERMLALLQGDDIATGPSDFALAEADLAILRKDVATARLDRSRAGSLFSKLVRRAEYPVLKELERDAAMLGSANLLYLGFVMIERMGAERDFGADVLRLVVKKFGRTKDGETAKQKLKTQGA
jgi:HEAT repeat protein